MRKLPKAIPELNGGLFVPKQVADLLEVVLRDHAAALAAGGDEAVVQRQVMGELQDLLCFTGDRLPLPSAREQLAIRDPQQERVARNLLVG